MRQKTKQDSNFCAWGFKANNKGISIICPSCAQKQNLKIKLPKLCRKIKTS